jgi:hydrogenase expression/formation protein HypE
VVVAPADLEAALAVLEPQGGAWIGEVRPLGGPGEAPGSQPGRVLLRTAYGSERLLAPLSGELLPRIC